MYSKTDNFSGNAQIYHAEIYLMLKTVIWNLQKLNVRGLKLILFTGQIVLWTFIWRLLVRWNICLCIWSSKRNNLLDSCSLYKHDIKKCVYVGSSLVFSCLLRRPLHIQLILSFHYFNFVLHHGYVYDFHELLSKSSWMYLTTGIVC